MLVTSAHEQAAGAILFRMSMSGREYLLIRSSREKAEVAPKQYVAEFWDFPKGRLEYGETGMEGAKREVEEEVGISDLEFMPDFEKNITYTVYRDGIPVEKDVRMYLAEAKGSLVNLSSEHNNFSWLAFEEAVQRVTVAQMKEVLRFAGEYLERI